jgi:hypothetical protein
MAQACWFEMYQTLLNDSVFETIPFENSVSVQKLFKLSACYILMNTHLEGSTTEFPMAIWDHYYLQRSIFLKSIGIRKQDTDLDRLEKLIFTVTGTAQKENSTVYDPSG